jgi:hypothetical protein
MKKAKKKAKKTTGSGKYVSFLCGLDKAAASTLRERFKAGLEAAGYKYEVIGWDSEGVTDVGNNATDVTIFDRYVSGDYGQSLTDKAREVAAKATIIVAAGGLTVSLAAEAAAEAAGTNRRVLYTSGRLISEPKQNEHKSNAKKGRFLETTPKNVKRHPGHLLLKKILDDFKDEEIGHLVNNTSELGKGIENGWQNDVILERANETDEIKVAFTNFVGRGARAIIISADSFFSSNRQFIVDLADQINKPVCYPFREYVEQKGLLSIGPDLRDIYFDLGTWAATLLNDPNASPPDPTVKQPVCTVNLQTAIEQFKKGVITKDELAAMIKAGGEFI